MRPPRHSLTILLLIAVTAGVLWVCDNPERGASQRLAEGAVGRVSAGMPLAEAERALDDAWYHAACPYEPHAGVSNHLFLYGSHDPSKVGVVFIRAEGPLDAQVVGLVTRLEIGKSWKLSDFDHCFPPDFDTGPE